MSRRGFASLNRAALLWRLRWAPAAFPQKWTRLLQETPFFVTGELIFLLEKENFRINSPFPILKQRPTEIDIRNILWVDKLNDVSEGR